MKPEALPDAAHEGEACKNCGTLPRGKYCHECGQPSHVHVPSAREFLHEFLGHYVALEGKLWKSLARLLFKPGFLSREYIEGRRVRYIEPLRLYLTFSIIFFALFKLGGTEIVVMGNAGQASISAIASDSRTRDTVVGPATPAQAAEFERFKQKVVGWTTMIGAGFGQKTARFLNQPTAVQQEQIKRAFFSYTPYAIFALMPVFAFYLKLLYLGAGRLYGEHFLFALHSNAFAFLMLSVMLLVPGDWDFVRLLLILWLLFYLPTAMRRVYGGGRIVTGLRWILLMALHVLSIALAVAAAVGVVLLA